MESESYELYQRLLECESAPIKVVRILNLDDYFNLVGDIFSIKCMDYFGNAAVYSMFKEFEVIRQDLFKDQPSFILINHHINNKINLKDYLNIPRTSSFIELVNCNLDLTGMEATYIVTNLFALDSKVNLDNLLFSKISYNLLDRAELSMDHKRSFPIWGRIKNYICFWLEDDYKYYNRQYRVIGNGCNLFIKSSVYIGSNYKFRFHIPVLSNNNKINIELTNFKYVELYLEFYEGASNNEINLSGDPRTITINGKYWDYKAVNKITLNGEDYD